MLANLASARFVHAAFRHCDPAVRSACSYVTHTRSPTLPKLSCSTPPIAIARPRDCPRFIGTPTLPRLRGCTRSAWRSTTRSLTSFPAKLPCRIARSEAGARFSMIAENIAEGPSPQGLHTQWMNSAPHRANLLDRQLNSIGIAVVQRGNVFFAAEDFAVTVPHLSFEEQESQVRAQLADYGLRIESDAADARKTCAMDRGFAGAKPALVLRYEMADLSQLPEEVETARTQRQVSLRGGWGLRSQRRGDLYALPHRHRVLLSASGLRRLDRYAANTRYNYIVACLFL